MQCCSSSLPAVAHPIAHRPVFMAMHDPAIPRIRRRCRTWYPSRSTRRSAQRPARRHPGPAASWRARRSRSLRPASAARRRPGLARPRGCRRPCARRMRWSSCSSCALRRCGSPAPILALSWAPKHLVCTQQLPPVMRKAYALAGVKKLCSFAQKGF